MISNERFIDLQRELEKISTRSDLANFVESDYFRTQITKIAENSGIRSEIAIPIKLRGEMGVFSLSFDGPKREWRYFLTTPGPIYIDSIDNEESPARNVLGKFEHNIQNPPGCKLLQLSEFLFSRTTHEEIFLPIVGDWREEYFNALSIANVRKASWIRLRYAVAFVSTMLLKSPIGTFIEFILKMAK